MLSLDEVTDLAEQRRIESMRAGNIEGQRLLGGRRLGKRDTERLGTPPPPDTVPPRGAAAAGGQAPRQAASRAPRHSAPPRHRTTPWHRGRSAVPLPRGSAPPYPGPSVASAQPTSSPPIRTSPQAAPYPISPWEDRGTAPAPLRREAAFGHPRQT